MSEASQNSIRENKSEEPATKDVAVTACTSLIDRDEQTATTKMDKAKLNRVYTLKNFMTACKSYVLSSEDDFLLRCANEEFTTAVEQDPMFVIVDTGCVSNPSSKELLVDPKPNSTDHDLKNIFARSVMLEDLPSTSKALGSDIIQPKQLHIPTHSESKDEMQMIDINLQSDNDILFGEDSLSDENSIVISYIRNRDSITDTEGLMHSNKKKSSLLESVRKMETILEGDTREISDTSLDVNIPSFPGSPRSLHYTREYDSIESLHDARTNRMKAVEFLHVDNEFLIAAELGNVYLVGHLLIKGTNPHQVDHLGRNALHLAVSKGNKDVIQKILSAGVDPNVKDSLGMTPLYICLMRRPLLGVANMLFKHGALILPRNSPMDTGLFIQFIMMCVPTKEEALIIELLVKKGAMIDDPDAPGGRQALHFAAMSNNCKLINILVDLGADLFLTNHRNETPREVAYSFHCKEAATLLGELEDECILSLADSNVTT